MHPAKDFLLSDSQFILNPGLPGNGGLRTFSRVVCGQVSLIKVAAFCRRGARVVHRLVHGVPYKIATDLDLDSLSPAASFFPISPSVSPGFWSAM